jgi:hypothetical protein
VAEELTQLWDTRAWALNLARLRLDLYRLVAAILASEKYDLSQLEAERAAWPQEFLLPVGDVLQGLAGDFESAEIEHGLISVAAMTRVLLDQISPRPAVARLWCGTLVPDLMQPATEQPLTLRDACNKTLHATTRSFVLATDEPGRLARMFLTGTQLGRQWQADLHVLPFASHVAVLTDRERIADHR